MRNLLIRGDKYFEARFLSGRQQDAVLQAGQPRITSGMAFVAFEDVAQALVYAFVKQQPH